MSDAHVCAPVAFFSTTFNMLVLYLYIMLYLTRTSGEKDFPHSQLDCVQVEVCDLPGYQLQMWAKMSVHA